MDGTYIYQEPNSEHKSWYSMGRDIGCSVLGEIKLKNGYCYINILGSKRRVKFTIEESKIIINTAENEELIFDIIDDNTINYMGCNFVRKVENIQKEQSPNINSLNKTETKSDIKLKINKNDTTIHSFNEIQTFTNSSKIFDNFDGCGYLFAKNKKDLEQNKFIFAGYLYGHQEENQEDFIQLVLENKIEKLVVTSCKKNKQYNFENKTYKGTLILPSVYEDETRTQIFKSAELKIDNKNTGKTYFSKVYGESVC